MHPTPPASRLSSGTADPGRPPTAEATETHLRRSELSAPAGEPRLIQRFVMAAPLGLRLHPAVLFACTAQKYAASIRVAGKRHAELVDGKSITGMLTLEVRCGDEVMVSANGADAAKAVSAIAALFANAFGQRVTDAPALSNQMLTGGACAPRREQALGCA